MSLLPRTTLHSESKQELVDSSERWWGETAEYKKETPIQKNCCNLSLGR
jgi:hypothetical protein